jgi:tetratricopeptide (TPR) repeat protein
MSKEEYRIQDFIQLDDSYVSYLKERVQFYLHYRHFDRALSVLEMLHMMDEGDVGARILLSQTMLNMGDSREAEEILEPLIKKDPFHPDAVVLLARIRIAQGKHPEAASLLNQVVDADHSGATRAGRRARTVAATVVENQSTETRA